MFLQRQRPEIADLADKVKLDEPTGVQSDSSSSDSSSSSSDSSSSSESSESESSDSEGGQCREKKHSGDHGDRQRRKR